MRTLTILALVVCAKSLCAQTDASLLAAGYSAPAPIEVAPGQILTLFLHGVKPAADGFPRSGQAQAIPLPDTIAGLSAHILQSPRSDPFRVPILSVRQQNDCEEITRRPICLLTAIRVQIPTELSPAVAKLVVEEDGQKSRTFLIRPVRDNGHVITSCDLTWDTNPGSSCARMAYHADGVLIGPESPARRGEAIVLYAYGMGPTTPRIGSGIASPAGAVLIEQTLRQVRVSFDTLVNANPSVPRYQANEVSGVQGEIVFAGLTPDQVGLYQINVRLPHGLDVPIHCGGDVRTNVVAKVSTSQGVENVPLCVEP